MLPVLERFHRVVTNTPVMQWSGRVIQVRGNIVESEGPIAAVGERCTIVRDNHVSSDGEVVGFRAGRVLAMPLDDVSGIRFGDRLICDRSYPSVTVSADLIGRVIDSCGVPIDGAGSFTGERRAVLQGAPAAMERAPIRTCLPCGVRAIDAFLTCGRGQRIGIFGGSGVGKSTLVGMMVRNSTADVIVLGLIGERGREVREFLEDALGEEGRRRAVVVVSTSDESPLLRIRGALTATTVAEYFRDRGKHVLLILDSLTRLAMAQREVGLAAGEPPTAKGYTPSVFAQLARIVERAGASRCGSITAFYSVLMEGDDQMDPIVDAVRSLLDGHIILDRKLASEGHYPPIHILDSISRLMPAICSSEHLAQATQLRLMMSLYSRSEDLVKIGAYQKGSFPELDRAVALQPALRQFLQQTSKERADFNDSVSRLLALGQTS